MTFNDDDLKLLKKCTGTKTEPYLYYIHRDDINALLARLEAAERVIEDLALIDNRLWSGSKYVEAWRKAAGK